MTDGPSFYSYYTDFFFEQREKFLKIQMARLLKNPFWVTKLNTFLLLIDSLLLTNDRCFSISSAASQSPVQKHR